MKINVEEKTRETKEFTELSIGTPFFEDSWEVNSSDVDMLLMKCEEGTNTTDGSRFNAVYLDDGTFTWVKDDKEVFPIDARIEVKL